MNSTVITLLSIMLMVVSLVYLFVYVQKRKKNTEKDRGYKVIFLIVFCLLSIPIIFTIV
jgi:hypothetical protein